MFDHISCSGRKTGWTALLSWRSSSTMPVWWSGSAALKCTYILPKSFIHVTIFILFNNECYFSLNEMYSLMLWCWWPLVMKYATELQSPIPGRRTSPPWSTSDPQPWQSCWSSSRCSPPTSAWPSSCPGLSYTEPDAWRSKRSASIHQPADRDRAGNVLVVPVQPLVSPFNELVEKTQC